MRSSTSRPPGHRSGAGPAPIDSPGNEVVRRLRRLGRRREPGAVLLEGPRVVQEAVAAGVALDVLAVREDVPFRAPAAHAHLLTRRAAAAAGQTVTPQGVLAIGRRDEVGVGEALAAARAAGWPLVVLDGVQDPGNVGTICRTAAAAGAPALCVLDEGADPLGAKAVRASAGHVFRLQVARATWADLAHVPGYAAVARGGASPERIDPARAGLLVLGSETHGIRRPDLEPVTISTAEGVESLNVAAAAAVLLFEFRRRIA
ncbi:MAG: RNA methyltransferase [bacterium]|nr:RNA methyltransferase [bacterium]